MRNWPEDYRGSAEWSEKPANDLTNAGHRFLTQHVSDLQFFTRDLRLLETLDDAATVVDGALSQLGVTRTPLRNRLQSMGIWAKSDALDESGGELIVTRYVDSYLTYVAELLHEVLLVRPEILSSQEQITVEESLTHSTMEELVAYLADRKVSRLSFKGLGDLDRYFSRNLGVGLVDDPALGQLLREWVALRNLVTHRRGVVDLRAHNGGLPPAHYALGEQVRITRTNGFRMLAAVVIAVFDLDRRIIAKFDLPRGNFEQ